MTASSPIRLNAQIQTNQSAENEATQTNSAAPDFKEIIAAKFNESAATLDAKQMEKESLNSGRRAKLSKGQKTGLYIGIAAAIAVTVVIIVLAGRNSSDEPCYATCTAVGCPPAPPCP